VNKCLVNAMNDSYNIYGDDEEKEIDGIGKLFFEV
jgi:hypothetical protein